MLSRAWSDNYADNISVSIHIDADNHHTGRWEWTEEISLRVEITDSTVYEAMNHDGVTFRHAQRERAGEFARSLSPLTNGSEISSFLVENPELCFHIIQDVDPAGAVDGKVADPREHILGLTLQFANGKFLPDSEFLPRNRTIISQKKRG